MELREKINDIILSYCEGHYHLEFTEDDLPNILNEIEEVINYNRCCTMLKDKKTISFNDYIKENGFTYKIDYTYLDADGNEWLEEEIKILMKSDY
jgi:hypothetical protein